MHLLVPLLLVTASAAPASEEVPFEPSSESFADAGACKARLVAILAEARQAPHVAAEGPYEIASGDVRAHKVLADASGHSITEHRCLGQKLSTRTWRHSMEGPASEEAETIDAMAAKAEWLKHRPQR